MQPGDQTLEAGLRDLVFYEKYGAAPGVVVCRENLELHTRKLLIWSLSALITFQDVEPLELFLEGEGSQYGNHCFRPQSGVVKEEGPAT